MSNYVYVDTETTGFDIFPKDSMSANLWKKTAKEELLSVSVIGDDGECLFHSLIKPKKIRSWEKAQAVNGISPEMVENAPFFDDDVKDQLKSIFKDKEVVIYNWSFDSFFLRDVLPEAKAIYCCMREYAGVIEGKWQKLINAVKQVNPSFEFDAHNSLEDCKATREVWHYVLQNKREDINFENWKSDLLSELEWFNTKIKKYYFAIPEAKNDEALRKELKEYGAYWETKKQAWVYHQNSEVELPEFLKKFQQVRAKELATYTKKYFTVIHPQKISFELSHYFGCQWDSKYNSWYKLVPENDQKIPEELQKFIDENRFEQVRARGVPHHIKIYFSILDTWSVGKKLEILGCEYDSKKKLWYKLVPDTDRKLPEELQKFINEYL